MCVYVCVCVCVLVFACGCFLPRLKVTLEDFVAILDPLRRRVPSALAAVDSYRASGDFDELLDTLRRVAQAGSSASPRLMAAAPNSMSLADELASEDLEKDHEEEEEGDRDEEDDEDADYVLIGDVSEDQDQAELEKARPASTSAVAAAGAGADYETSAYRTWGSRQKESADFAAAQAKGLPALNEEEIRATELGLMHELAALEANKRRAEEHMKELQRSLHESERELERLYGMVESAEHASANEVGNGAAGPARPASPRVAVHVSLALLHELGANGVLTPAEQQLVTDKLLNSDPIVLSAFDVFMEEGAPFASGSVSF